METNKRKIPKQKNLAQFELCITMKFIIHLKQSEKLKKLLECCMSCLFLIYLSISSVGSYRNAIKMNNFQFYGLE